MENKYYELAEKLGLISAEDTCMCEGTNFEDDSPEERAVKNEMHELQDTVLYLSNELLKKQNKIDDLSIALDRERRAYNKLNDFCDAYRADIKLLQQIVDKMENK